MKRHLSHAVFFLSMFALLSSGASAPDSVTAGKDYDTYRYVKSEGQTDSVMLPKNRSPNDYTPVGFVRQPSFVRGGGVLNKGEHAFTAFFDGDLLPPPLMIGYRYGVFYWWDVGFEAGADYGAYQALARTRIENLKSRKTEAFFWSNEMRAGFKLHNANFSEKLRFDDRSLVLTIDNSLAYRPGPARRNAIYLLTSFYIDYDLHQPRRQTDYYLMPVTLGWETMAGERANFFIEIGAAYSINGTQFADGSKLYDKSWFPVFKIGTALRSGARTAVYYTRETKTLSRDRQAK